MPNEEPVIVQNLKKAKVVMRIVDWAVAIGFLAWGVYTQSWVLGGLGVLSVAMALYNPARRLEPRIAKVVAAQVAARTQSKSQAEVK